MAQGNIKFNIGFNVDQTGLNSLKQQLSQLSLMTEKDLIDTSGLQRAGITLSTVRDTAQRVGVVLQQSFNAKLNTYNIDQFKTQLAASGLTIQQVQTQFSALGATGTAAFRNLTTQLTSLQLPLKQSHNLLNAMGTTLANTAKWMVASSALTSISSSVQKAWSFTTELDKSLNDIMIVTDKSAEQMERFAKQANNASKALGATTKDYTNAALIYYQQGLGEKDVLARSDVTVKAANVTGQSTSQVSEQLTAIWNGYKVSAEEAELYIDKVSKVAASTAADLEELSEGMQKVASGAATMGVDIDQLNGQLATIISVTRQDASVVGTALKTIFARLGDLQVEGVDEFGTTLGEVSGKLKIMGIDILDSKGDMREMGDVIEEVAAKWETWTSAQQQAAAVAMAGKRQYNNLIALFENWDMYESAKATSQGGAGELEKQNQTYLESFEAKINQLSAASEKIYMNLIDSDSFKGVIDGLTGALNFLGDLIDTIGGGGPVLLALLSGLVRILSGPLSGGLSTFIGNLSLAKSEGASLKQVLNNINEIKTNGLDAYDQKILAIREHLIGLKNQGVITNEQFNDFNNQVNEMANALNEAGIGGESVDNVLNKSERAISALVGEGGDSSEFSGAEEFRAARERGEVTGKEIISGQKAGFDKDDYADLERATMALDDTKERAKAIENQSKDVLKEQRFTSMEERESFLNNAEAMLKTQDIPDEQFNFRQDNIQKLRDQFNIDNQNFKDNEIQIQNRQKDLNDLQNQLTQYDTNQAQIDELDRKIKGTKSKGKKEQFNNEREKLYQQNKGVDKNALQENIGSTEQEIKTLQDKNKRLLEIDQSTQKLAKDTQTASKETQQLADKGKAAMDKKFSGSVQNAKNKVETLGERLRTSLKSVSFQGVVQGFTNLAASAGMAASGIMMIVNAWDVFKNEDMTAGEKAVQFISSFGFGLAMVLPTIGTASTQIGKLLSLMRTGKAVTDKETASIATNTLARKINNQQKKAEAALNKANLTDEQFLIAAKKQLTKEEWESIAPKEITNKLDRDAIKTSVVEIIQTRNQATVNDIETASIWRKVVAKAAEYWWISLIIIGVAALAVGIYALVEANTAEEKAMKASADRAKELKAAYDEVKSAYEDLMSTMEKYEGAAKSLDELSEGTAEWKEALLEANEAAISLIKTYPELASMLSKDDNGLLAFNEEELEKFEKEQLMQVQAAQNASIRADQIARINATRYAARSLAQKVDIASARELSSDTMLKIANLSEDVIANLADNKEALSALGITNDKVINSLAENSASILELKQEVNENNRLLQIENAQLYQSQLEAKGYNSDEASVLAGMIADRETYIDTNWINARAEMLSKHQGDAEYREELIKRWAKAQGVDIDTGSIYWTGGGNFNYRVDGETKKVSWDTLGQDLAYAEYQEAQTNWNIIAEQQKILNQVEDGQDIEAKKAIEKMLASNTAITRNSIENYSNATIERLQQTLQEVENGTIELSETQKTILEQSIENLIKYKENIGEELGWFDNGQKSVQDAILTIQGIASGNWEDNAYDIVTTEKLGNAINTFSDSFGEAGFDSAVSFLADLNIKRPDGITPEKLVEEIDWAAEDLPKEIISTLHELEIPFDYTNQSFKDFLYYVSQLNNSLPYTRDVWGELLKIAEGLEDFGDTLSSDDYTKLYEQYGTSISKYFVLMEDGTYALTTSAMAFQQAVDELNKTKIENLFNTATESYKKALSLSNKFNDLIENEKFSTDKVVKDQRAATQAEAWVDKDFQNAGAATVANGAQFTLQELTNGTLSGQEEAQRLIQAIVMDKNTIGNETADSIRNIMINGGWVTDGYNEDSSYNLSAFAKDDIDWSGFIQGAFLKGDDYVALDNLSANYGKAIAIGTSTGGTIGAYGGASIGSAFGGGLPGGLLGGATLGLVGAGVGAGIGAAVEGIENLFSGSTEFKVSDLESILFNSIKTDLENAGYDIRERYSKNYAQNIISVMTEAGVLSQDQAKDFNDKIDNSDETGFLIKTNTSADFLAQVKDIWSKATLGETQLNTIKDLAGQWMTSADTVQELKIIQQKIADSGMQMALENAGFWTELANEAEKSVLIKQETAAIERYNSQLEEQEQIISLLEKSLEKLDQAYDIAFNKNKIAILQQQNAELAKQINLARQSLSITQNEINRRLNYDLTDSVQTATESAFSNLYALVGGSSYVTSEEFLGYFLGKDRTSISSAEDLVAIYSRIDELMANASQGEKDKATDWKKELQEIFGPLIDALEEQRALIAETITKALEKNLEQLTIQVEIDANFTDAKRSYAEFIREISAEDEFELISKSFLIDVSTATDAMSNIAQNIANLNAYEVISADEYQNIIDRVTNNNQGKSQAEIEAMIAAEMQGKITEAAYEENLMELRESWMEEYLEIQEAYKSVVEQQVAAHEKLNEAYEKQIEYLDVIISALDHQQTLNAMIYGEKAYARMDEYYKELSKYNQAIADSSMAQYNANKKLFEEIQQAPIGTFDQEYIDAVTEAYLNSGESAMEALNTIAETKQQEYLNAIELMIDNFEKDIFGTAMSELEAEWNWIKKNDDFYLDDINSQYSLMSLREKFNSASRSTKDLTLQRRINALRDEELSALETKDKLTEYDLERAEKRLAILQAEIELENTREQKSKMRLMRGADGTYSYQYVADTDKIAEAQQKLLDAQNDLYNFDKDRFNEMTDEYISAYNEFMEKLREYWADGQLTMFEQEDLERYKQFLGDVVNETGIARDNLYLSAEEMVASFDESWKNKGLDELLVNTQTKLAKVIEGFKTDELDEISTSIDTLAKAFTEDLSEIQSGLNKVLNGEDGKSGLKQAASDLAAVQKEFISKYDEQVQKLGNIATEVGEIKSAWDATNKAALQYFATLAGIDELNLNGLANFDTETIIKKIEDFVSITGNVGSGSNLSGSNGSQTEFSQLVQPSTTTSVDSNSITKQSVLEALRQHKQNDYKDKDGRLFDAWANRSDTITVGNYTGSISELLKITGITEEELKNDSVLAKNRANNILLDSKLTKLNNTGLSADNWFLNSDDGTHTLNTGKISETMSLENPDEVLSEGAINALNTIYPKAAAWSIFYAQDLNRFIVKRFDGSWSILPIATAQMFGSLRKLAGFDTGGYTGTWGSEGKLAMLHEKELVLNKFDTANILAAVDLMSKLDNSMLDTISHLSSGTSFANAMWDIAKEMIIEQNVHIDANFPAVNSRAEIEEAFSDLVVLASQHAFNNDRVKI